MFRYPVFFTKLNAKFGFTFLDSPKYVRLVRWMGIVEMTLAGLSAINLTAMAVLGIRW
jgi:hypothetical protein